MKAIQIKAFGGPEVLQLQELPRPQPGKGQVLVELKAAGLNFIDIYMRNGIYAHPLPFVPGREGAGIVAELGEGVSDVKVGDRVAYTPSLGSYAEYALVDAGQLISLPDDISFEQGAAFPLQGMTAHYLLHEYYKIKPGDYVLVHAAAGGMGLLLVQWLKQLKAIVIGTVSTEAKAKMAKEAGADHVILYAQQDFAVETLKITQDRGADYIIDGVGKTTFSKNLEAARKHGWICIYGSASGPAEPLLPNTLQIKSLTVSGGSLFNYMNSREEVLMRANAVLKGMREGWLKMKIDRVFTLDQAAEAQAVLESRQTSGKVILKI